MADDEKEVAVQINGKTRAVVTLPVDVSKEDANGKFTVKGGAKRMKF